MVTLLMEFMVISFQKPEFLENLQLNVIFLFFKNALQLNFFFLFFKDAPQPLEVEENPQGTTVINVGIERQLGTFGEVTVNFMVIFSLKFFFSRREYVWYV